MCFLNRLKLYKLTQVLSQLIKTQRFRSAGMFSNTVTHDYNSFEVQVLPALSDNFMYLLIDKSTKEAAVVDPADPECVIRATQNKNVFLTTVLTTHHHYDHAGGNSDLIKRMKDSNLTVYGGDTRIPSLSKKVSHGEEFKVGTLLITCLHTPCHTTGHMCYFVTSATASSPVVFTGDTLFVAGCGRFFEGTPEEMNIALNEKLGSLPDETKVYCGHEYTKVNLKFAKTVEPHNEDIEKKLEAVYSLGEKEPTVPSSIGEEKKVNPFMRINIESVQRYAKTNNSLHVMKILREKKNSFHN